jgi:probable HAF family extracellular repeat protein
MNHSASLVLVFVALFAQSLPALAQTPGPAPLYYKVTGATAHELPRLGGSESVANDVNDLGQIVGWSLNQNGISNAFLVQKNGTIQNIGAEVANEESSAKGINNNGEVVGYFIRKYARPFYWHAGTGFLKLSIELFAGASYNDSYGMIPEAINDFREIVGGAYSEEYVPGDTCHRHVPLHWNGPNANPAYLFCSLEPIGTVRGYDVSNSGWIVGGEQKTHMVGWRYINGSHSYVPGPSPIGHDGELTIHGVNESGAVTGMARDFLGVPHAQAIYWDGETSESVLLGYLPGGNESYGEEINDQRIVAGYGNKTLVANGDSTTVARAFVWHRDFGLYELPLPGEWSGGSPDCHANALNNVAVDARGHMDMRVVGYCEKAGKQRAVYWVVTLTRERGYPSLH